MNIINALSKNNSKLTILSDTALSANQLIHVLFIHQIIWKIFQPPS